jgi:hypothetical protein
MGVSGCGKMLSSMKAQSRQTFRTRDTMVSWLTLFPHPPELTDAAEAVSSAVMHRVGGVLATSAGHRSFPSFDDEDGKVEGDSEPGVKIWAL